MDQCLDELIYIGSQLIGIRGYNGDLGMAGGGD